MKNLYPLPLACLLFLPAAAAAQVSILGYSVNTAGQVRLEIPSSNDKYYLLHVRHSPGGPTHAVSIALGKDGTTTLTEPLAAYPKENYTVTEHPLAAPADTDGDGQDDLAEFDGAPATSPFNRAKTLDPADGVAFVPDRTTFETLSYKGDPNFQIPELQGLEVVKFFLLDKDSTYPQLYFLSKKFATHTEFAQSIGAIGNPSLMTGLVVFYPNLVAANGALGVYRFNFQPQNLHAFRYVQRTAEMLAANMPFLKNNLCYYPYPNTSEPLYFQEKNEYDASRVCVVLDDDIYGNLDYLALHPAEGYGLLRHMTDPTETPRSRDVVIYDALPNSLPRVGGIITTVTQTPLSHVNLRAIQDNLPNAFIRDASQKPAIAALLGKLVFYKVEKDTFTLRAASQQEVDDFYEKLRPEQPLVPVRDLTKTEIEPLDSIAFGHSASFGVKCANVATMRTFGFPAGTVPDGFGVPFFFYDEFMKFNGFYEQAQDMLAQPDFQSDVEVRQQRLEDFRKKIKAASMPLWMLDALETMQETFPAGTSIRCRSSTNNEDLPGFSGAGLYDSKTHHPDEGHIAKTIRQVYASMWNYRAFDEREFYRVDHLRAAMGVLVHPNFENEQANGVGVSVDPVYQSKSTFYLNTQVGEDLVTNPNALSVPEEMLLEIAPVEPPGYAVMQPSNQAPADSLVFKTLYHNEMRSFLGVIHERFRALYRAEQAPDFAMEIEYKIEASGQLVIKQARPWASFWVGFEPPPGPVDSTEVRVFPNPFAGFIRVEAAAGAELELRIFSVQGQLLLRQALFFEKNQLEVFTRHLPGGAYVVQVFDEKSGRRFGRVLVKK